MTKNVEPRENTSKGARLQFTIMELLLFALVTFVGMGLMSARVERQQTGPVCLAVILATTVGALMGSRRCGTGSPLRKVWLIGGIAFGWFAVAWLYLLLLLGIREDFDAMLMVALMGLPIAVPLFLMFLRAPATTGLARLLSPIFLIPFVFFYPPIVLVLISSMFRSCPPYCHGETASAAACKAFAEAEEIYHRTDYSKTGIQYAMNLQTLLGANGELALIDKTFAQAEIGNPKMAPKAGYYFKVLTAQGPSATGGRHSYLDENGHMTRGYALIAIPAAYDVTGRDSFIINNSGTIFQQDLGPNTPFLASAMTEFDPDTNWVPTQ